MLAQPDDSIQLQAAANKVFAMVLQGQTALHLACSKTVVDQLLQYGARIDAEDAQGDISLFYALHSHVKHEGKEELRLRVIEALLKAGLDVNQQSREGSSSLHLATMSGDARLVALLLRNGAQVDAVDKHGHTPLMLAALCSTPELVHQLLGAGADVSIKDTEGSTALHAAATNVQMDYAAKGGSLPPEWWGQGCDETVEALVLHGADVNAENVKGRTPLHCAVWTSIKRVSILLQQGAKVNAKDAKERIPMIHPQM
ncbi:hypothetical protein ABBQ38_014297 [Trebouxia sp. C0009 RCD-2024]